MKDISNCKIKVMDKQHLSVVLREAIKRGYDMLPAPVGNDMFIYFHLNFTTPSTSAGSEVIFNGDFYKEIYFYQGEFHEEPESLEVKPSVGLCPREVFWEKSYKGRVGDLLDAMKRYHSDGKTIPLEWVEELEDLVTGLEED